MAGINDNDALDLAGTWTMLWGYTWEALLVDPKGQFTPPGATRPPFTVIFTFDQDTAEGKMYKGIFVDYPGKFTATTYYRNQGRQLVEILLEHDQTLELHSGAHVVYSNDPGGVHVVGGWVNCGGGRFESESPGNPYLGWFKMEKQTQSA